MKNVHQSKKDTWRDWDGSSWIETRFCSYCRWKYLSTMLFASSTSMEFFTQLRICSQRSWENFTFGSMSATFLRNGSGDQAFQILIVRSKETVTYWFLSGIKAMSLERTSKRERRCKDQRNRSSLYRMTSEWPSLDCTHVYSSMSNTFNASWVPTSNAFCTSSMAMLWILPRTLTACLNSPFAS